MPPLLASIARRKSVALRFDTGMLRIAVIAPWHPEQLVE